MAPIVFLVVGLILVWAVMTGRAEALWRALFSPDGQIGAAE